MKISEGRSGIPTEGPAYTLLTNKRERKSGAGYETYLDNAISDRARVLYSGPFRRLQDKAQVFSLESNAAIRSRLTHSLEVAHIGRSIAARIANSTNGKSLLHCDDEHDAFVTIVETACLMHDLGNPPFGHFGEAAIKEWFECKLSDVRKILDVDESKKAKNEAFMKMYGDFTNFDGNAQTLRIATRIQFNIDKFGFNLTHSQLAAVVKYPWAHYDKHKPENKKAGVFHTERDIIETINAALNLSPGQRHLLVYLVEAADDISYCMSDIEDAIEKRVIRWNDFISYIKARIDKLRDPQKSSDLALDLLALPSDFPDSEDMESGDTEPEDREPPLSEEPKDWQSAMLRFRTKIARYLMDHSVVRFEQDFSKLIVGDFKLMESLIDEDGDLDAWPLAITKDYAKKYLYGSRPVRQRELVAHRVIHGILDNLFVLLNHRDAHRFQAAVAGKSEDLDKKRTTVTPSVASLLPKKYLAAYNVARKDMTNLKYKEIHEWGQRAHLIVDYLSGMTDRFALDTYRLLLGIDTSLEK